MDDIEQFFTPQDRSSAAYMACVGGMGLTGAAVGRFGGLQGLFLGAAVGVAYGLLTCKKLSPIIERKFLSKHESFTDGELKQVLAVLGQVGGVQSRSEGMYVLAHVRHAVTHHPSMLSKAPSAHVPAKAGVKKLLQLRQG